MGSACEYDYTNRLAFLSEWYDPEGGHNFKFYMNFFPYDNSVELWERPKNKIFLRRSLVDGISINDMFVGNTVRIYGRQINITDYGDEKTRKLICKKTEKTFTILKPTVIKEMGPILSTILLKGFKIVRAKMCQLTGKQAMEFYEDKKSDSFLPFLVEHLGSGPVIALVLVGENAIDHWRNVMGPRDPAQARREAPDSLRALYGQELVSNAFHGSDTTDQVEKSSHYFFPPLTETLRRSPLTTAKFKKSTCCVIKPHAIVDGQLGNIITDITNHGFKVTALEMFYLSNPNADEFLEVYKGVVSDFNALMLSFIDGPCVALEIGLPEGAERDVHKEFRVFCGPADPDVARQIRPNTLRARYGVDRFKNAVHCTDLPEDTTLELEYFFKLLEN